MHCKFANQEKWIVSGQELNQTILTEQKFVYYVNVLLIILL